MPVTSSPSVAVLVDLDRSPTAGGHVKAWERFAEAAAGRSDMDLTLYVLDRSAGCESLGPSARVVAVRPVLPTRALNRVFGGGDATDLAPYHPTLARHLVHHDVWHLTSNFAFAATALRRSRSGRRHPLVASVHTDVPHLAGAYLQRLADRLPAPVRRPVQAVDPVPLVVSALRRRRDRALRACRRVLVSSDADAADLAPVVGADRVGRLRRGIDRSLFARVEPRRDAVPDGQLGVLFVGRVDASKRALLAGETVRLLRAQGCPVTLVVAGTGADAAPLQRLLGEGVRMLGAVPQPELPALYAACAALLFPSLSETAGNVVAEAMACGLPPVLPEGARTTSWLRAPGRDGVVVAGDSPQLWAQALLPLLSDESLRAALGREAARTSATCHPTWAEVLEQDLLPVWRDAAERGSS